MKKKLMAGIALAAAVAVTGGILCACGGKGEQVTKEEFVAAASAENFANMSGTSTTTYYVGDVVAYESYNTVIIADGSYIMESHGKELKDGSTTEYDEDHSGACVVNDGTTVKYYVYRYEGSTAPATTWFEVDEDTFYNNGGVDPDNIADFVVPEINGEMYDLCTFDKKTGRYKASQTEGGESYSVEIEFHNKKITYYALTSSDEDGDVTESSVMVLTASYGGQTVDKPIADA